jgi:hypothetical protein
MPGGWCYVKELRRLGASGGQPRQHLEPWDQIEDYKSAVTYVEGRSDITALDLAARAAAAGILEAPDSDEDFFIGRNPA